MGSFSTGPQLQTTVGKTSVVNGTLKCLRPNVSARMRLFCFPYAGSGASAFRNWPQRLPPSIEIFTAQLPGREARLREPPFTRLSHIVEAIAPEMLPYLDKPFAFFGHSMGALIGFELARHLRREHCLEPAHLFLSGHRASQLPRTEPLTYDLPEPQFLTEVARLNGTPREVLEHAEIMQLILPLLRADFAVCQTYAYVPGPPLTCSLTALGGLQDDETDREQLRAWREQTTGAFSLHMLPGDHFFVNTAQEELLRIIARDLDAVMRRAR